MSQVSGDLTVDQGYRVREAGGVRPSTSVVEERARRAAPGAWDEDLGQWGSDEWRLPGQGERGARCGEWYPEAVCDACGEVHFGSHVCGKRSCPDCWTSWAHDGSVRATERVQAFRYTQPDDYHRQAAHVVVSPPEGDVMNYRQYKEGKKEAAEIAQEKGLRGFAMIAHPFRVTPEGKREYRAVDPEYGIWVWLREDVEDMERYIYWSPHYHIIGPTSADMDEGTDGDEWTYSFIRSFGRFDGIHDSESHEEVYGAFRYLLSHTGYPEGSTDQVVTWYGDLANSVFVEDATEGWQHEKPSEGVRSALEREIEEAVGPKAEGDESDESGGTTDDVGECPVDGCDGVLIDVFDVSAYLRQTDPPPGVRERMVTARDWRLGRIEPPSGMKRPQTEEHAEEALQELL